VCVCARINAHFRERIHVHVCVSVSVCVGDVLDRERVYKFICVYLWVWVWDMCADACVGVHLRTLAAVACKHTQILPLRLTFLSPPSPWPPTTPRFLVPLQVTQENYLARPCTGRDYWSRSPSSCSSCTFSIFATRASVGLQCVCVYISQ